MEPSVQSVEGRPKVRSTVIDSIDTRSFASAIDQIYDGALDVVLLRNAFPGESLAAAGKSLDLGRETIPWARPNAVSPVDDIYILGTDTPATPTFKAPRGASLESYLESAGAFNRSANDLVKLGFDITERIEQVVGRAAGGRPVSVAVAADGRPYVPYTVRLLGDGKQISIHHDYHYSLALYKDLAPRLDTSTLVSFFVTLQKPEHGGELVVYALQSDSPNQPRLPSGQWDVDAISRDNEHSAFVTEPGDLLLLAAGRCFHRVERVRGSSRVTLGGFLAFDKSHSRVFYWS